MLQRTFSFWRRLMGSPDAHDEGGLAAVEDDRRLWMRYEADIQTHVQLAQPPHAERVSARLRNVSLGGAELIADQPFEAGHIVSLELPSAENGELQLVLACVVRVKSLGDGRWSLGCVFSRELSNEDLEKFGARKARPAAADQRTWVRFECDLQATYQRIGDDSGQVYSADVLNISASGVGLQVTGSVEPGCLLNLTLHGKEGRAVRTILACVVHTTQRAGGELAIGCNFIRSLGEDDLTALL